MIGEPVVILTPTSTTDRYGDVVDDWSTPTTRTVTGAAFDPGTLSEDNDGRTAVIAQPSLLLPPGTTIASNERVRVRGVDYEVVGGVADWRNPFTGVAAGVTLALKRVDG